MTASTLEEATMIARKYLNLVFSEADWVAAIRRADIHDLGAQQTADQLAMVLVAMADLSDASRRDGERTVWERLRM